MIKISLCYWGWIEIQFLGFGQGMSGLRLDQQQVQLIIRNFISLKAVIPRKFKILMHSNTPVALFFLIILVSSAFISDSQSGNSPDHVMAYRLFIKERNEQYVRETNSQGKGFVLQAYPEFARFTVEEFSQRYSNKQMGSLTSNGVEFVVEGRHERINRQVLNTFPNAQVNNSAELGPIKPQGQCGGCYSFAGNSVVNYAYNKYYFPGQALKLASQQEIIQCSHTYRNNGCDGGWPHQAMQYVKANGVATDRRYRYRYETYMYGILMECEANRIGRDITIQRSNIRISQYNTVESMKNIIDTFKVAAIGISTKSPNIIFYRSGILSDCGNATKMDHAVTLVGYTVNQERGEKGWLLRNSWGVRWGIEGYFFLSMGNNTCNMLNYAAYLSNPLPSPQ